MLAAVRGWKGATARAFAKTPPEVSLTSRRGEIVFNGLAVGNDTHCCADMRVLGEAIEYEPDHYDLIVTRWQRPTRKHAKLVSKTCRNNGCWSR